MNTPGGPDPGVGDGPGIGAPPTGVAAGGRGLGPSGSIFWDVGGSVGGGALTFGAGDPCAFGGGALYGGGGVFFLHWVLFHDFVPEFK